ncbi:MAG TPA: hypothetical protein DD734_05745 [Firmicutes bacterium]|nr:hypothetical protein [Bacillota bacterium]
MAVRDSVTYNLEQALTEEGCPVCRCLTTMTRRYLENLLYEFVNDPRTRDRLRASAGFCREHAWTLQQMGDPLAHSIIYADLIDGFCQELRKTTNASRRSIPIFHPEKAEACPVCREETETEERYVVGLVKALHQKAFRQKYRQGGSLCLPHFRAAYGRARDGEVQDLLVEVELDYLSHLSGELQEFIRKSDYRYAGELPGTERDAWIRAVQLWVGPLGFK